MSRVISGWVVSKQTSRWTRQTFWQAWRSGETRLQSDSYFELLGMIRDKKRDFAA